MANGAGRITFYVALAVFAQEATWNFYDNRVPELLRDHVSSAAVIGLLMGMDNLLGVFIQPYMGHRSDNTRTAWGRRIPYLAVLMPVGAALFLLIPHAATLGSLILVIFLYALVMNSFRPVSESLMPDFIEPAGRSRANAAVKIASALTTVVAALVSLLLVDDHPKLAFAVPSGLMLVAAAVLVWRLRDSRSPAYQAALTADQASQGSGNGSKPRLRAIAQELVRDPDRSRPLLILAVFVFAGAWFASRSLMTPYGVQALGLSDGEAGGLTLPSGIAFLLAAYPAALFAERFGRPRVMVAGMAIFAAGLVLATVIPTATATVAALCLAAAGAAGFIINAVVVLWNLAPSTHVLGAYTGLYTVGWASGGLAGPALVGLAVDVTGWDLMLLHIAVLAGLAALLVVHIDRVRRRPAIEGSVTS